MVAAALFNHLIVALVQADQIRGLDGTAQCRIECCAREACRVLEGVIPEFDRTGWLLFSANHSQAVGIFGVNRVGLLKQD